ncbi:MAG: PQQ-binding-like beta-propeller repeat protein [Acidobacteriota bacterium]|nr:PQQ-binding-like beta-propeller repeat protein [Acidobacteriota bacterium]
MAHIQLTLLGRNITACVVMWLFSTPAYANDWPQWRGQDRLGVWHETGIIETLPEKLKISWRVPINSGYSGPAVADGRVFVTDWQEDPQSRTVDGRERLLALDEETGKILWSHEWPTSYRMLMFSYAVGPRATPTVDGNRVYVVGATGRLLCLHAETGAVIWEKDYVAEYDTSVPTWGISSSPLVDGDRLITLVGGEPDGLVMAFNKETGAEIWRAIPVTSEMGYAQPVIYEAGGARQLVVWHPTALTSLDPETGEIYWDQPWEVQSSITVATPTMTGNYLLVSQFYRGSMMMRLNTDRPTATMLWQGTGRDSLPDQTDGLHAMITTPLIIGNYIYGVGSYGELRGLDARTGERLWTSTDMPPQARWGGADLVEHGDRYFVHNDDGDLIIAQFTPTGYVEHSRTNLIQPTTSAGYGPRRRFDRVVSWSHPAYANRHVVQRNDQEIIRASLDASDY